MAQRRRRKTENSPAQCLSTQKSLNSWMQATDRIGEGCVFFWNRFHFKISSTIRHFFSLCCYSSHDWRPAHTCVWKRSKCSPNMTSGVQTWLCVCLSHKYNVYLIALSLRRRSFIHTGDLVKSELGNMLFFLVGIKHPKCSGISMKQTRCNKKKNQMSNNFWHICQSGCSKCK